MRLERGGLVELDSDILNQTPQTGKIFIQNVFVCLFGGKVTGQ